MKLNRFAVYAWGVLAFNIGVIVWGAYVRATGSGAGCGQHWPTCQGEIIPRTPQIETLVEFSHRATSGLAFLAVLGILIWAYRLYPKKHPVRLGATLAMIFMVTEALVGAGLVLFKLVAYNESVARVFSVSIHLLNTFLLLASMTLTAWWASGGKTITLNRFGKIGWSMAVALLGVLLLGLTGTITALGDTLFPTGSLSEGITQDFLPTAHFLVRLRVWHPLIALAVGLYLIVLSGYFNRPQHADTTRKLAKSLAGAFLLQLVIGIINLLLLAPVAMQMLHLLAADGVWIVLILLSAAVFSEKRLPNSKKPTPYH